VKALLSKAAQAALLLALMTVFCAPASAIPAFARKYSLRCTACHESWPVLNDFGRSFRDNGYQLRLGKDNTVTAEPGYWPAAAHVLPNYSYTRVTNQETDQGAKTIASGGVADASMDLLMAGVLTKDISFLVVPTGFASDGAVSLESYWAYFSRAFRNSDWFNVRIGQFELDLPTSGHRTLSLTDGYLMYSYHPSPGATVNAAAFDMGENQRGIELVGHDVGDLARYSVAVFSAHDSAGSQNALSSPSFYAHLQKYFRLSSGPISQFEVGAWGVVANYPTTFLTLTSDGVPINIAGSGHNLQTSTRYGVEANVWIGPTVAPLHLDFVYGRGVDKKELYSDPVTGAQNGDRDGTWNGGFIEALWVPPTDELHWGVFGRVDVIRNQKQPLLLAPDNYNDQTQWTLGARYTIAYSTHDEVAFHAEVTSRTAKGVGFGGLDQRTDAVMLGVDFVY
jgi:hypothetical protein